MNVRDRIKTKQKNKKVNKTVETDKIDKASETAAVKNGVCLSTEYQGLYGHLNWQCKEGHVWKASYHNVVNRGQWCSKCSARKANSNRLPKWTTIKKTARDKGGMLLSRPEEYVNSNSKLKWQCNEGHVWNASYGSIKHTGTWCPYCKSGYRENLVRFLFENYTGLKFPKTRPRWLLNPITERQLELDGYNEKHNIAFEYNGLQHYKQNNHFHKNNSLEVQKYRDHIKKNLCEQQGVELCNISYRMTDEEIKEYVKVWIESKGLSVVDDVNLEDFKNYKFTRHERFKRFVESIGYELLSSFKTVNSKVDVKCDKGHLWVVQPRSMNDGNRCPYCSRKRKYTLEDVRKEAKKINLLCLDKKYYGNTQSMSFKCNSCGKRMQRTSTQIMNKEGCKCGK